MSITKRKDRVGKNRWLVRIESPDPVTGARRRVTVGTFPTKREAEREEAKAITGRERGTLLALDSTTVAELLDRWLEVDVPRTVKPEQIVNYETVVRKHLKPAFGEVQARKLTVERVERLYADLQAAGYSSSLIRNVHLRLSAALKLAKRWGLVADNVCDVAKPPKLSYRASKIWTAEETAAFLEAADDDPLATYWRMAVETGARTSELLGLTWDDLDLERGTVRLGEQVVRNLHGVPFVKEGGKSAAARRTIGLSVGMLDVLREHRREWAERKLAATAWEDPYGLIFCSPRGRPLNSRNVRRTFDRLIMLAGVTPIPPHSLRKGHITSAIAAGGNLRAVQARVGHSDPATTLGIYTQLTAGMEASLMDIVNALAPRRKTNSG